MAKNLYELFRLKTQKERLFTTHYSPRTRLYAYAPARITVRTDGKEAGNKKTRARLNRHKSIVTK